MTDKPHIVYSHFRGWSGAYSAATVDVETPRRITFVPGTRGGSRCRPDQVVARFADHKDADELVQRLDGAAGERDRRKTAADAAFKQTAERLIKEATK